MNSVIQSYDRSLALRLRVETLTQQFDELKRLRERIQRVEAIYASRYQRSRWRKQMARCRSLRRHHGLRVH